MVLSFDVTRRILTLGSRDATTGWKTPSFTEETIDMINLGKGVTVMNLGAGQYARIDELGQTADPVNEGDQIIHQNMYYSVEYVKLVFAPGDNFHHRDCGLVRLPLWQASPSSVTWTKTRLSDAKRNTKAYVDGYVRSSQITKNDDSTLASWACIWENPPYPLTREFPVSGNRMDGLYVVCEPVSTPLTGSSKIPYGYDETVPIHIITVDSFDCTGIHLLSKMEMEMREVCRTYPEGSVRTFERRTDKSRSLGSMWLYDVVFELNYKRLAT